MGKKKKGPKGGSGNPGKPATESAKPDAPESTPAVALANPNATGNGASVHGRVPDDAWPDEPTPIKPPPDLSKPEDVAPLHVDPPTGTSEKRLFRRIPFFRKIHFKFESLEDFRSEFAADLSLGGMFIRTDQPEPVGSVVFLKFDLKDGSKILSGYGKVVRVNPKATPDFDPGMGVEFLKFDEESLTRIKQLVAERFGG